jgi:small subunit ribosomal protein S20
MANHKSALKRIRQNDKRRLRNRDQRGTMRSHIKAFRVAVDAGDVEAAGAALRKTVSVIDHVRTRGVIHRNTAARRISRLTLSYNKLVAAQS